MATKETTHLGVLLRGGFIAVLLIAWAVLAKAQTTTAYTLEHDGESRTYRVFFPTGYSPDVAIPLVLNLHGRGSNGLEQAIYSNMSAVADTAGFAVCYPDGLGEEWNVGWSFGSRTDDVGFLTRLIDTLHARHGFDESRTYACGMSNGGFMSYVLACERSDRIAAIASVTGGMLPQRRERCSPELPVAVMQIHGTADPIVQYNGTASVNEPIEDTVEGWAALLACDGEPSVTDVPDADDDGYTSQRLVYGGCEDDYEVQLIRVEGGGHTWPGSPVAFPGTTYDFSATEEVWGFLRRFRRGGTSGVLDRADRVDRLEVFPNPVVGGGQLSLKPMGRARVIEVRGVDGRLLRSVGVPAGAADVDLGGVATGTYLVRDAESGASARVAVE